METIMKNKGKTCHSKESKNRCLKAFCSTGYLPHCYFFNAENMNF